MKKKFFLSLIVVILSLSLALCFVACKGKDPNKIRIVEVTHSVFYAPLYIAIEKGYLKDEGLDVELTNGGGSDKSMTAILSGQADMGLLGSETVVYVYDQGREDYPVIFGQLTKKDGSFLVGRKPVDNFDWKSLAGSEIIGGRTGGMPAMTLEYALSLNGLIDKENITINYGIQFDMIIPAFAEGTGDYCTMFEPAASEFVKSGKGHILASVGEMAGDMPFTAFMATKSYISENNTQMVKFMSALQKAIDYLHANSAEDVATVLLPSFNGTDLAILSSAIQAYKDIDAYCSDMVMKEADLSHLQDVIIKNGLIQTKVPFDKVVDNTIAELVKNKS